MYYLKNGLHSLGIGLRESEYGEGGLGPSQGVDRQEKVAGLTCD